MMPAAHLEQDPAFAQTRPALHHVGFVVASIEAHIGAFAQSLGAAGVSETYHDPLQRVRVAFVIPPAGPQLELVEPSGEKSPVAAFLARGGGLHHLCYEVSGLEAHLAALRRAGATLARPPKPAVAFGGRRIAWVITRQKLLLEYLERDHPTS